MSLKENVSIAEEVILKVKKMINSGFVHSSNSLAQFTKEQVFSGPPEVLPNKFDKSVLDASDTSQFAKYYIVSTDLIGAIECKSYLILSQNEVDKIIQAVYKAIGSEAIPKEEILKEIDNILAAGVTTIFSNQMNATVYGGVPILQEVLYKDLFDTLQEDVSSLDFDLDDFEYFVTAKTTFTFSKLRINPQFIWVIPDTFIKEIR